MRNTITWVLLFLAAALMAPHTALAQTPHNIQVHPEDRDVCGLCNLCLRHARRLTGFP